MALEKWEIPMGKVLVTTTIHLQLPFSLSLCKPLFHLTEAGNVKTRLSAFSREIAGLTAATPLPPSLPFSCGHNRFMDKECHWGAPHAALFSEAGNTDVASAPTIALFFFFFLLKRSQTAAAIGHHGQSLLLASDQNP